MLNRRWFLIVNAFIAISAGTGRLCAGGPVPQHASAAGDAAARAALSGAWVMNPNLSDTVTPEDAAEENLLFTLGANGVKFYERDGSWRVYGLSGRRERHDLGSGPVWTRASWDGTTLRIQVDGPAALRIVQTFALDAQTGRLVVTTSPDSHRLPMSRLRLVYDPVISRTP